MPPVDYTFPQSSSGFPKLCSAKHGFRAVLAGLLEKNVMTGNLTPLAITSNLVICSDAVRSLLSSVCVNASSQKDFPQSCLSRLMIRNKDVLYRSA